MKKFIAALLAFAITAPTAFAADNAYSYNKFVYNILLPDSGLCNIDASFVGHEVEYPDVNSYFKGIISIFNADLDNDGTAEMITVESENINVYTSNGKDITFCDSYSCNLIGNSGDSYSNVFIKDSDGKEYLGVETFSNGAGKNEYALELFTLDPETRSLKSKAYVCQSQRNNEMYQTVSKDGVSVFSHTDSNGISSTMDPENFTSIYMAAKDALWNVGITDEFLNRPDRLEFNETQYGEAHRLSDYVHEMRVMTYIIGKGVRTTPKPVVIFENYSPLGNFTKPAFDISVTVNDSKIEFADQTPVIINDRTLVPVRAIFEVLGADVSWLPQSMKVVANTSSTNITMTIGSSEYFVNGEKKTLDVPPMLINDRTMVPARAVAESFGCKVDWDDASKTVIISNNSEN